MAGWFDKYAKKSAASATASATPEDGGISRRRVLVGGSAAVAAAWTAPVLMASSAAAAGLSVCPPDKITTCDDGSQTCCPNATDTCIIVGGQQTCNAATNPGGFCGNCGEGSCKARYKCNGNEGQSRDAEITTICGGEGAQCCTNAGDGGMLRRQARTSQAQRRRPGCSVLPQAMQLVRRLPYDGGHAGEQELQRVEARPPGLLLSRYCATTCSKDSDCSATTRRALLRARRSTKVCNYSPTLH